MIAPGLKSGFFFGLVGLTAAGVHTLVFWALRDHLWPELANALGFVVAFGVSFVGHRSSALPATG